ncbi:glycosyltransferase [Segetibacter sp. 3557_3]|uniref:TIGR04283 family arsenosugar biosynthesis glycosyltransferase n=1 Tax=Segetibacter sp. 3557_3 TaxID=2547429 RepID=UPI0010584B32|nr:TIGR04283 family arsenosugar biosynthesis glycosyltransferase [Segetibacter sp. 3557_3]TDH21608.1 glycosyltransferase [Segetibacter sp. 3557_3]
MISIIIPTYNEADQIATTIHRVLAEKGDQPLELIVVDGGSSDATFDIAQRCGAKTLISHKKGRGAQMNAGAAMARGEVLYFLHADSIPPPNFTVYINKALENGAISGCFRLQFDYAHWFLKANCWFTRFNVDAVRFGDQSLFVTKEVFGNAGGYREELVVMEDQEIIGRIKRFGRFKVMNAAMTTSARKYHDNGIYNMQLIFFRIWLLYYLGYSQEHLVKVYKSLIRKHKL